MVTLLWPHTLAASVLVSVAPPVTEYWQDEVPAGSHSMNPLLSVFSGIHDVVVVAHGEAAHGVANVHVDSVALDGIEVPSFVLALFVEKFVTPNHPNLGIDSRFA